MTQPIATYAEFWPHYLRAHSKPATRALHYVGTALALAALFDGLSGNLPALAAAVFYGYAFAWIGHFFVEKNRPATFTHPWWSLISDFRMFWLFLVGGLRSHLESAGVATR
jgi:hypothetical protein